MKLYTNIMPFSFKWGKDNKPEFVEVGTTFAVLGADFNGIILKLVSEINDNKDDNNNIVSSINIEVFKVVFKEVEHLTT